MVNIVKKQLKNYLLRKKNIQIDRKSSLNYNVDTFCTVEYPTRIVDSKLEVARMGKGCFLEHVTCYGKVELGDFVSISGPGTILHAEIGKIKIGSFCSIAENVGIHEFNHIMGRPTTSAVGHIVYKDNVIIDFVSKGDIVFEEDVWVGSNAIILSGVTIGRGAVIAAGAVVTHNIPPYSIVGGNPAKIIKKRFNDKQIAILENSQWWEWDIEKILENQSFFTKIMDTSPDI